MRASHQPLRPTRREFAVRLETISLSLVRRTDQQSHHAVSFSLEVTLWYQEEIFSKSVQPGWLLFLFRHAVGLCGACLPKIPGGTLDPLSVPKFKTPLLIPPVMPKAGTIQPKKGPKVDYYEISMRQFEQQILPAPSPQDNRLGLWRGQVRKQEGVAAAQRALAHHRGEGRCAGAREMDQ